MAGIVKVNEVQLGDNADATKNFVLRTNVDGTLTLARGNVGATTQDILKVNALGVVQQVPQSMVRLNTANGYGSTNTAVRRFTNIVTNQGSDITYADSATLGASFTINTDGVYAINFCDQFASAAFIAITLNSTTIGTASSMLASSATTSASFPGQTACPGVYLPAGSVVRAVVGSSPASGSSTAYCSFTISRVA